MKKSMSIIAALLAITLTATTASFAQSMAATDTAVVAFQGTGYDTTVVVPKDTGGIPHTLFAESMMIAVAQGQPQAVGANRRAIVALKKSGTGGTYTGNGGNIMNAMATRATANARNRAWANALRAANYDSTEAAADPAYIALRNSIRSGDADVRVAISDRFVSSLVSATPQAIKRIVNDRIDELIDNGTLVTRRQLQVVAHEAAVLQNGSNSQKKAAAKWLAEF